MKPLVMIALLITCQGLAGCERFREPEIFLIPENYRSEVYIIYDQPCSAAVEYEGNRRVYRIPENGILLTEFKYDRGTMNQQYFLVDSTGKRKKLFVLRHDDNPRLTKNPRQPMPDEVVIGNGGSGGRMEKDILFQKFRVIHYDRDNDTKAEFRKEWARDSTMKVLLENCRKSQEH